MTIRLLLDDAVHLIRETGCKLGEEASWVTRAVSTALELPLDREDASDSADGAPIRLTLNGNQECETELTGPRLRSPGGAVIRAFHLLSPLVAIYTDGNGTVTSIRSAHAEFVAHGNAAARDR